jgi:hypothetical protein
VGQTRSLLEDVSPDQLQIDFQCLASTVPSRSAKTDFAYGDPYELLALASSQLRALMNYCWNCNGRPWPQCNARYKDKACYSFVPLSSSLSMLDAYGLSGTAFYEQFNPVTGKVETISLLDGGADQLQYCSLFSHHDHSINSYFETFPSFLTAIKDAESTCGMPRQLPVELTSGLRLSSQATSLGRNYGELHPLPRSNSVVRRSTRKPAENGRPPGVAAFLSRSASNSSTDNPLELALSMVGADNGGLWYCEGAVNECFISSLQIAGLITYNTSDFMEAQAAYRYLSPVYVAVDVVTEEGLEVRYSVAGELPNCDGAWDGAATRYCGFIRGKSVVAQAARTVEYGGKTRIVVYARSQEPGTAGWNDSTGLPSDFSELRPCSALLAWTCSAPSSAPERVSVFNITDSLGQTSKRGVTHSDLDDPTESFGPLEPGPLVQIKFLVSRRLGGADLTRLRRQVCGVVSRTVWLGAEGVYNQQCEWLLWADIEDGANVEMWSDGMPESPDGYRGWVPSDNGQRAEESWTVSLTALIMSNVQAQAARVQIMDEVNSPGFASSFHLVPMVSVTLSGDGGARTGFKQYFSHVTAPTPAVKRGIDSKYGCLTNYECAEGMFCSYHAVRTWSRDDYVGFGPACDACETCLNDQTPVDGKCPEDKCGPRAGTFPRCWDASQLLANLSCPDRYALNLSASGGQSGAGSTGTSGVATGVAAPLASVRARFLTPFNRMVGALLVRQKRLKAPTVDPNRTFDTCALGNDSVARYSDSADPSRGFVCLTEVMDTTPFGTDPAFASYSSLYDGRIDPLEYYNKSEFASLGSLNPFGFFPHSYDQRTGTRKAGEALVEKEADSFLVFVDERVSNAQARRLITYLEDGNFIDQQTQEISVELNTLNARNKILCKVRFVFTWKVALSHCTLSVWAFRTASCGRCASQQYSGQLAVLPELLQVS